MQDREDRYRQADRYAHLVDVDALVVRGREQRVAVRREGQAPHRLGVPCDADRYDHT